MFGSRGATTPTTPTKSRKTPASRRRAVPARCSMGTRSSSGRAWIAWRPTGSAVLGRVAPRIRGMGPELSVVVPMYNEEQALPLLVARLRPVLDRIGRTYEVVAVDDGSQDLTAALLQKERRVWPQLRVLRLRANAGHQAAISAGLVRSHGDFVVTIDADLQDPPESIAAMLELARSQRLDVVYGVRSDRSSDTLFKRTSAQVFYRLIRRASSTEAVSHAGDFRMMSRATVDAVNVLPEHNRVLRFVVPALGFPSGEVHYQRAPRAAGASKYTLGKMLTLSIDSFTGFSTAPLRSEEHTSELQSRS